MPEKSKPELVLDVGNTRVKLGLFQGVRLLGMRVAGRAGWADAGAELAPEGVRRCIVGSVAGEDPALIAELSRMAPVVVLRGDSPSPVRSVYTTRDTLGVDRLANAVAAAALFPRRPVLAISMGTCITFDLVDELALHRGGMISPGLRMRAKAMHAFSARLPEVELPAEVPWPGTDTASSLAAGVFHGALLELRGHIEMFSQQYLGLVTVLTGGDALRMVPALKSNIFAHPALTLIGLHALAHYETDHRTGLGR